MQIGEFAVSRIRRRHFLAATAGAASAVILVACGSGNATPTSAPATAAPAATAAPTKAAAAQPTTASAAPPTSAPAPTTAATPAATAAPKAVGPANLQVWGGVPSENGPSDLVTAFQKAYPAVKVTYTRFVNDPTGNTKLDTALQGGTPIDAYFAYDVPRMGQRIKAGVALDLSPYLDADSAIKKWATTTKGIFTYQGKIYSLPTTREPNFFFVNKKLADAAGATFKANWTIADFQAAAKTLSSGTGDKAIYGAYAPPDVAREILGPDYWYKNGGKESNFDNPAWKTSLELHRTMITDKTAFPWTQVLAQNLKAYSQNPFLTSQVALWQSSSFSLRYVNDTKQYPHAFVTTFLPMPAPTGVASYYNGGGINNWLLISPKSQFKDAAWLFTKYWLTDGARYMLKAGKIPSYPGTSVSDIVAGILGPDRATLYDVPSYQKIVENSDVSLVTDTITTGAAEIQKIVDSQTDRYLIGEITIDQWIQTVKQQADAAIKKGGA